MGIRKRHVVIARSGVQSVAKRATAPRMMRQRRSVERIALRILLAIAFLELVPIVLPLIGIPWGFIGLQRLGAHPGTPLAWILAAATAAAYVRGSIREFPGLRERLGTGGLLRVAAIVVSVAAGITEEVVFRKAVMDPLLGSSVFLAVAASAVTFGVAHGVWGFFGGWRVARGAMLWTGMLGAALGIVYVAGGRSLLPCIASHAAIDLVLEPALILAALSRRVQREARV